MQPNKATRTIDRVRPAGKWLEIWFREGPIRTGIPDSFHESEKIGTAYQLAEQADFERLLSHGMAGFVSHWEFDMAANYWHLVRMEAPVEPQPAPATGDKVPLHDDAYSALQYVEASLAAIANRQEQVVDVIHRIDTIAAASKRAKAALTRLQGVAHHFADVLAPATGACDLCSGIGRIDETLGGSLPGCTDVACPRGCTPTTGDEREALSDERIKEIGLQHGFMCVEDGRVFVCSHTYGGMVDSLRSLLQASAAHRRDVATDGEDNIVELIGAYRDAIKHGTASERTNAYVALLRACRAAHRREDQRDAERYRWLRTALFQQWFAVGEAEIGMRVYGACPSAEDIDAAIDAAMQRTAAPAHGDTAG